MREESKLRILGASVGLAIVAHVLGLFLLVRPSYIAPLLAWLNWVPIIVIFLYGAVRHYLPAMLALPAYFVLWLIPATFVTHQVQNQMSETERQFQAYVSQPQSAPQGAPFREYTNIFRSSTDRQTKSTLAMMRGEIDRAVTINLGNKLVFEAIDENTLGVKEPVFHYTVYETKPKPILDCTEEDVSSRERELLRANPMLPFCIIDELLYDNISPVEMEVNPEDWPTTLFADVSSPDRTLTKTVFGKIKSVTPIETTDPKSKRRRSNFSLEIDVQLEENSLRKEFRHPIPVPVNTLRPLSRDRNHWPYIPALSKWVSLKGPDIVAKYKQQYFENLVEGDEILDIAKLARLLRRSRIREPRGRYIWLVRKDINEYLQNFEKAPSLDGVLRLFERNDLLIEKGILKPSKKRAERFMESGLALCLVDLCSSKFLTRATRPSLDVESGLQHAYITAMREANPEDRADAVKLLKAENARQNAVIKRTVQTNPVLRLLEEFE